MRGSRIKAWWAWSGVAALVAVLVAAPAAAQVDILTEALVTGQVELAREDLDSRRLDAAVGITQEAPDDDRVERRALAHEVDQARVVLDILLGRLLVGGAAPHDSPAGGPPRSPRHPAVVDRPLEARDPARRLREGSTRPAEPAAKRLTFA